MEKSRDNLTIPTLHLNGSGFENLQEQYRTALEKLREAREALPIPHGRDYYVQDDGAYTRARGQFEAQRRRINEIEEELSGILLGILDQHRR